MTKAIRENPVSAAILFTFACIAILHGYPCSSVALAQTAVTAPAGPTYHGFDLTPLISGLVVIIGGLLAWLGRKVAAASSASEQLSKAQRAQLQLAGIGLAMVGDLWNELSVEFQLRIADGKIDADDRAAFKRIVEAKLEKYSSAEQMKGIAEALGLPLPGVIAKIVEYIIDRLTKAHDPRIAEVSAKAYPIDADDAELERLRQAGG